MTWSWLRSRGRGLRLEAVTLPRPHPPGPVESLSSPSRATGLTPAAAAREEFITEQLRILSDRLAAHDVTPHACVVELVIVMVDAALIDVGLLVHRSKVSTVEVVGS